MQFLCLKTKKLLKCGMRDVPTVSWKSAKPNCVEPAYSYWKAMNDRLSLHYYGLKTRGLDSQNSYWPRA